MKYNIGYAVLCHKGFVRAKNQDNFWCANVFLENENDGLSKLTEGTVNASDFPAFAVFDGMGGEQQGEMAAYIAAKHFDSLLQNEKNEDTKKFLLDACAGINTKICEYQEENHIRQMGTTGAVLMCGQEEVFICNLGDSRIYKYSKKKLTQISHDHISEITTGKKPPLTQNLGIPESEFIIEPYTAKAAYNNGDRYLLCSDGLTDMVSQDEIAAVFSQKISVAKTAQTLMNMALENGGADNITIIICEVSKAAKTAEKKRRFSKKTIMLLCISILLAAGILSGIIALMMNGRYTPGNTAGNIINFGIAAINNDWIYYSNDGDAKIYRVKTDSTNRELVN